MLQCEEKLATSDAGQEHYKSVQNSTESLVCEKSVQRDTLNRFGFNTTDESLEVYRSIFPTYYNSPMDYDEDVIAVFKKKNNI